MARIRTVKPELFRHEALFEAEQDTHLPLRLAFIGLFACCDREGRFRWQPRQLKLDVLPYDPVDFGRVLEKLASIDVIVKYKHEGQFYGCIPTWHKHQTINQRESVSRLPAPGDLHMRVHAHRCTHHTEQVHVCGEKEREKEKEGKGINTIVAQQARPHVSFTHSSSQSSSKVINIPLAEQSPSPDPIVQIFSYWQQVMSHPRACLDKKRKALIGRALQSGYSLAQLCQAIEGCSRTPHNMGNNDRGERYDGLHVILQDGDQIDRFIHNCEQPPRPLNATERKLKANVDTLQQWVMQKTATTGDCHVNR